MLYLVAGALEAGVAPSGDRRRFPTDSMKGGEGEGEGGHSPHRKPALRTGWSAFPFLCSFKTLLKAAGGVKFHSGTPT